MEVGTEELTAIIYIQGRRKELESIQGAKGLTCATAHLSFATKVGHRAEPRKSLLLKRDFGFSHFTYKGCLI